MSPRRAKRGEEGFVLLLVFAMAAAVAIMLYMELPRVAFEAQRNQEQLLIERGEQYKRAIQLYFRKFKQYPPSIDRLENTNNIRFLRRRYADPLTGKDEWRLIHVGPGGVLTDSLTQKPKTDPNKQQQVVDNFITQAPAIGSTLQDMRANIAAMRRRPSEGGAPGNPNQIVAPPVPVPPPVNATPEPAEGEQAGEVENADTPADEDPNSQPAAPTTPAPMVSPGAPRPGMPFTSGGFNPAGQPVQSPGAPGFPGVQPVPVPMTPVNPVPGQQVDPSAMTPGATPFGTPGAAPFGTPGATPFGAPGAGQVSPGQAGFDPNQAGAMQASDMIRRLLTQPRQFPGNGAMPGMGGQPMGGAGGIAGVASKVEKPSIKIYNDQQEYNKWEFIYDYAKDRTGMGQMAGSMGSGDPRLQQGNQQGAFGAPGMGGSGGFSSGPGFGAQPGPGGAFAGQTGFGQQQPGFGAGGFGGQFGNGFGQQPSAGSSSSSSSGGVGAGFGGGVGAGFGGTSQAPGTTPQQPAVPRTPMPQPGPLPAPPPTSPGQPAQPAQPANPPQGQPNAQGQQNSPP